MVSEELEMADFTVMGALRHAAAQPDIEFYMSGGLGNPSVTSLSAPEQSLSMRLGSEASEDSDDFVRIVP